MKVPRQHLILIGSILALAATAAGQTRSATSRNNPYSPSPSGKTTPTISTAIGKPMPTAVSTPERIAPQQIAFVIKDSRAAVGEDFPAYTAPKVTPAEPAATKPASSIYRIGIGDVVFVNLKNSAQGSGYYTVREDGVIDYPLAGPAVKIANKTTDEVASMLRSSIKLFASPQVEVKVHYYLSRSFIVEGLADNPGEKVLRREAMPVFAIRAESEVLREANKIKITRARSDAFEMYSLSDAATDNVLVMAGDKIEFIEERKAEIAQYTILGVKKTLVAGTKLSQVVAEALGSKAEPKYAVIRRANDKGVTTVSEYELKSIKKGKIIDPRLSPGDMIDVKN